MAQWEARLTQNWWLPVNCEFQPHQKPCCFLEQETILSLLTCSTSWFQERIQQ